MPKTIKLLPMVITLAMGMLLTASGLYLIFWQDNQMNSYNQGVALYRALKFEDSLRAFGRAEAAYKGSLDRSWLENFIYPKPDREVAALTLTHKANALLRLLKIESAIKAYKEAIRLNPGSGYFEIPGFKELQLKQSDVLRLKEQARIAKYNLELLLRNTPEEPEKKGKGADKEAQVEEQKQIPQLAPGSQPGKGGKDDI